MKNKKLTQITYALLILGTIYLLLLLYFTPGIMKMYLGMFRPSVRNANSGWAFLLTIITFVILVLVPLFTFRAANSISKYNNRTIHYEDISFARKFSYIGGLVVLGIIANKEIKQEIIEFDELVAKQNN